MRSIWASMELETQRQRLDAAGHREKTNLEVQLAAPTRDQMSPSSPSNIRTKHAPIRQRSSALRIREHNIKEVLNRMAHINRRKVARLVACRADTAKLRASTIAVQC